MWFNTNSDHSGYFSVVGSVSGSAGISNIFQHVNLMNSRQKTNDCDEAARKRSHKLYYYNAVPEDCSDMADPEKVGTPRWTSGGKTIHENNNSRGNGIQLQGVLPVV